MKCKVCYANAYKFAKIENVDILKCPQCNFISYMYMPKSYNELYNKRDRGKYYKNYKKEDFFNLILSPYVKKGMKYLDVGCAAGLSVKIVNKLGGLGFGIDLDPDLINWGKKEFKTNNLFIGNIETIKLKEEYFDLIFLNHTIEHIFDLDKTIKNLKKILHKKGKIIIICPNYNRPFHKEKISGDHINYFTNQTLIKLFNNHRFKVVKNPKIKSFKHNLYYGFNNKLKNKFDLFQIWLTFEKNE